MSDSPALPPDDLSRSLAVARAESGAHLSVVGDTYTVLLRGADTGGRYGLLDMHVPPGSGSPPHRHDFEEMFTLLEGELEFTFREEKRTARAGDTLNVPANAPHCFKNVSAKPARMLCLCAPAGLEELFAEVGDPVASRTAPPPPLTDEEKAARKARIKALAPKYRTEILA